VSANRRDVMDAFDHQSVPFAHLVDELQPERDQSRTPLYQVAFTMHEWRLDSFALPGLSVEPFLHEDGIAKCDLTLQVQEHPDGAFQGRMVYATSLFDEETVERFVGHFRPRPYRLERRLPGRRHRPPRISRTAAPPSRHRPESARPAPGRPVPPAPPSPRSPRRAARSAGRSARASAADDGPGPGGTRARCR
ncbi:Non-ribosomal peptide synthetase, partial [Streptomyces clavuligerus]